MQYIVLDKSYLQGATSRQVQSLCENNVVLMIETLFYELLSTDEEQRAQCFRKLPGENPVELLPRPGPLFRYEIANGKAAYPVTEHILRIPFTFDLDATLDEERRRHLADSESKIIRAQEEYPEMAHDIGGWFPHLRSMKETERRAECKRLKSEMSDDDVRAVYRDIAGEVEDFPSHELLDPTWVLYRWTQARVIAGLDFVACYGFSIMNFNQKKLENHLHDMEYLTMAPLAGGIATRDKRLASNFELVCPGGRVIC
jgi:hypothetical protein